MSDTTSNHSGKIHQSTQSLYCSLCNIPYDDHQHQAKLLNCHHSYCVACLEQLAIGRNIFRCPECRRKTQVPEGGVEALQTNFYVEQMQQIVSPSSGQVQSQVALTSCSKHMNQPLLFYCTTCMVPICMNCTVLDHDKNAGHVINDIAAVVKSNHQILNKKMKYVEKGLDNYHQNLNKLKTEMSNLETAKTTALKQIDETFKTLYEKLKQRQEFLKETVEQHFSDRKQQIISHAHIVKLGAGELSQCKLEIAQGLETKDIANAIELSRSMQTLGKVDQLCEASEKSLKYENNYIQFHFDHGLEEFIKSLQGLGAVTCKKALPSDICSKTDIPRCTAGIQTQLQVLIKDGNGQMLENYPIAASIIDVKSTEKTILKPKHQKNGVYTFEFRPKYCGINRMYLLFNDTPIWGTEKDITVHPNNPVLKFGKDSEQGKLFHPTSVAVSSAGYIYVADMGNKRIKVFNECGKLQHGFLIGGSESTTYDIALNHATEEVVCTKIGPNDAGQMVGNNIRIFSFMGEKRTQFSNKEMKRAMFLDVNSKGQIIVTDSVESHVYIYSKEGVPVKKFGSFGTRNGQFNFPTAVAIGKDDTILIADTKNNRIQIFNKVGKFLQQIGPEVDNSYGTIEIVAPRGLTADSNHILVADSQNRILVLKYTGSLVCCIGSEGDPIQEPYNLALSGDDHVFVADFKNDCIKKYKYK